MAPSTQLSRRAVALAALTVLDDQGPAALTMRRVAEELGSGAMSIYRYVDDRDDMLRAVAEELLDAPIAEIASHEDWHNRVRVVGSTLGAIGRDHPEALLTVLASTPPGYVVDHILRALHLGDTELTHDQQELVVNLILPYLIGWRLIEHSPRAREIAKGGRRLRRFDEAIEIMLRGLDDSFADDA